MSGGHTARDRLERLLHVLPAASRPEGAPLTELARTLATSEDRILEDIEEVTARNFYHPGGWPDDVQIFVESGRVKVERADGFERPARLSSAETLCLALGLRGHTASSRVPAPEVRERLLDRAERYLAHEVPYEDGAPTVAAPEREPDPEGIREVLLTAARERTPCALSYVKAGARDASTRVVHPYVLAYGEGAWYAVGHCTLEDDIRVFRTDRVLAAELAEGRFEIPADFDPDRYLDGGRIFHARDEREVRVWYSARIARWIRERASSSSDAVEHREDGSLVVRHRVADPHWAVSHALQYGAEAEILEPADIRALVGEVADELSRRRGGARPS
ncbi:MAG: WYL domain-containing protein [Gemmatimonadota bacterium]|nr:WYL domain-containing protein [Gemmatimonadota bacterium]